MAGSLIEYLTVDLGYQFQGITGLSGTAAAKDFITDTAFVNSIGLRWIL